MKDSFPCNRIRIAYLSYAKKTGGNFVQYLFASFKKIFIAGKPLSICLNIFFLVDLISFRISWHIKDRFFVFLFKILAKTTLKF